MPVNAPKCSVCGSAHWLREPHVFTEKAAPTERLHPALSSLRKGSELPAPKLKVSGAHVIEPRPSGPPRSVIVEDAQPDRKAYMRDYMAKRRAEAKRRLKT